MSDRLYSPIYWVLEDEYPDIWYDLKCLGTFVHLLKLADQSWNGQRCLARYPADIDWNEVAKLKSAGLVLGDDRRFTILGLDKRRSTASAKATKAARTRWSASSNASSNAPASDQRMPSRAEESNTEKSKADAAAAFYDLQGGQASPKALKWVDEMARDYGDDAVIEAMAQHTTEGRVDLKATQSALALEAHHRNKAAEQARKDAPLREMADIQKRIEKATPEERAAAEARKAAIEAWMKGGAA